MKIAFCHNYYQQPGGEDQVFDAESKMMEENGHEVLRYTRHNDEIKQLSKFATLKKTFWNSQVYSELRDKLGQFKPDIVHFNNTFPLISPAAYKAARQSGASVVQTLHNFRLICPGAALVRNGSACERCVGKLVAWPAIWNRCYRDNMMASAVTTGMNSWHRIRGTYNKFVNRFIALTKFCKEKFVQGGISADRISIKQNFVSQPTGLTPPPKKNGRVLFAGRLAREKGLELLLNCWKSIPDTMCLDIVGDGPLMERVRETANSTNNLSVHGRVDNYEVRKMMAQASAVIVPSLTYETFGMVVVEAFSVGTPVIVSNHGALAELVESGKTGFTFSPNNEAELKSQIERIFADRSLRESMGKNALAEYEQKYTQEQNYELLKDIYLEAIKENKS